MSEDLYRPDGTRIALLTREGAGPTVVFLPGYASDMAGAKAEAIDAWAVRSGRGFVRFDYGGCGESGGRFDDQGLDDWLADALAVVDAVHGPLVLVGSSMGGWIMLLATLRRPDRIAGLVGIAAAPDFTQWGFTDEDRAALSTAGRLARDSLYGSPLTTTSRFFDSAQALRLLDKDLAIDVPVRLLQGQQDPEVPWQLAIDIARLLRSDDVQVTLIKDGDHRLSRPADLTLIIDTIERMQ